MLGLHLADLSQPACWVDTGADQLLVPVRSADAVAAASPDSSALGRWPLSSLGRKTAYVFHFDPQTRNAQGEFLVHARYFFTTAGAGVTEDPGTGSACANLGGWLLSKLAVFGLSLPLKVRVAQGQQVHRPCELTLELTATREILVGGRVLEVGRGQIRCA
jgi:trans-2,3-dihydro-3-hydroxyanthranilate isomerase